MRKVTGVRESNGSDEVAGRTGDEVPGNEEDPRECTSR